MGKSLYSVLLHGYKKHINYRDTSLFNNINYLTPCPSPMFFFYIQNVYYNLMPKYLH